MIIAIVLVAVVLLFLIIETRIVNSSVSKIDLKIHINGTRGKTTVTKYISAILRDSDKHTFGKVTGDAPILILPDGNERIISRRASARVQEQFSIINQAKKNKADALVMECMSIEPSLQKLESAFFKPDIYIITNIKDDHREAMGDTLDKQIHSICGAIPKKSKIISIESPYKKIIEEKTQVQGSIFIDSIKLTELEMNQVSDNIHYANIELAITAALETGISRQKAFQSILDYILTSQLPLYSISNKTKKYFLNAFSVNDTESATNFLSFWKKELIIQDRITVIFNTRSDRPLRTTLFSEWIFINQSQISKIILTGDHRIKARRILKTKNLQDIEIFSLLLNSRKDIRKEILDRSESSTLILGIGNTKGAANLIINEFSEAS